MKEYVFIEFYLSSQYKNILNYALSKRTPEESSTKINYVEQAKEIDQENIPYKR